MSTTVPVNFFFAGVTAGIGQEQDAKSESVGHGWSDHTQPVFECHLSYDGFCLKISLKEHLSRPGRHQAVAVNIIRTSMAYGIILGTIVIMGAGLTERNLMNYACRGGQYICRRFLSFRVIYTKASCPNSEMGLLQLVLILTTHSFSSNFTQVTG